MLAGVAGGAAEGEGASPEGPAEGACHALAEALCAGGVTVDGELGREEEVAAEREGAPERKRQRVPAEEDAGGSASSGRLYHSTMEQAVGLLEWCARFVDGGGLLCYEPQRFLWWLRGRNQGRTRFIPQEVMDAFDRVQGALDDGRTRPSLADPEAGHPGDGIAGDASTSTGWGLVVGEWVFFGSWTAETLAACEAERRRRPPEGSSAESPEEHAITDVECSGEGTERKVSISPLELLVQAFVVRAVRMTRGGELPNGSFFSRCDNLSSVKVVEAGRAKSPAMTEALRIIQEEEIGGGGERRLRLYLEHIGTLDNKVADLLSRGDIEEAKELVRARWGVCRVGMLDAAFVAEAERRVREAFNRDGERGW